jgi:two-component system sensor histidine kinase DesK
MINADRWLKFGRLFLALWVLFAVPSAVAILQSGHGPAQIGLTFSILAWGVIWVWSSYRAIGHGQVAVSVALVANVVVLALFSTLTPGPVGVSGVLIFVFALTGLSFPLRRAIWIVAGLLLLQIAGELTRQTAPAVIGSGVVNSVLVAAVAAGACLFWESYTQLNAAREQLAHLAVTEERLRFARDLHDLLGQSLSVLVLKSELVAKELPADSNASVRCEVSDIAAVARKSLNDLREAVGGYRRATLQAEISSARTALRAAGIGLRVEDTLGAVPPDQDGVLAWCLREAVTNVLKHSGAKSCEVRLTSDNGDAKLDVFDDGRGTASFEGGTGLAGMRERVELVGGSVRVASDNGPGLHVQVSVPRPA